jgi:ribosome modulation factor
VLIALAVECVQAERSGVILRGAGSDVLEVLREIWWLEQRDEERTRYTGDFDQDEESYRRGYTAALHPRRRDRAYADVEDELRTQYANTVLDRPFQSGYERGLNHRSRGVE